MSQPVCLIVEDEPDILFLSKKALEKMDINCYAAENLAEAKSLLDKQHFDVCLADMRIPQTKSGYPSDEYGMELVRYIHQNHPNLPVTVITAHGNVETAVQALKAGAFDFVTKPVETEHHKARVQEILELRKLELSRQQQEFSKFIGESPQILELKKQIGKVARSAAPIHIRGESGVGKELVAKMIHNLGARRDKSFVPVNCGAIPTELMESEFFGYKKGSFTGANSDKEGLFKAAHGGTLFLDEIAELPVHMQIKLLRVIQERQIRPVGADKESPVDVRILSATHQNLAELVKQGKFRQDLFFRINVIEINVPPLRERVYDIPLLVEAMASKFTTPEDPISLSPAALKALTTYPFPGNIRELENILERAATFCEGGVIQESDLHLPQAVLTEEKVNLSRNNDLDTILLDVEKQKIYNALEKTKGNKTKAAELLGLTIGQFRHRLKKLGITQNID